MRNKTIPTQLRTSLTLAYLLCIYTTLGVVRPIAEFLRSTGILFPIIITLFVGSMPLALFWRYRAITQKQFILRIFLIIFLLCSAFLISALPEERLHFLTYGLAGWLLCWSLEAWLVKIYSAKPSEKMNLLMAWLLPCFLVWLAGGVDELIQWWLPNRVFDIRDIIFNGTAGMTGIALFATGSRKSKENSATSLP